MNAINDVQQTGSTIYGLDAVGTDAYAITLSPPLKAYANGNMFNFKAGTANTGPATLNVNGLGAIPILKNRDQPLITGDIEANQIVQVVYNSGNFEMTSQLAQGDQPYAILQNGAVIYGTDSVGTDSYAVTLSPVPASYVTGMVVNFKAGTANTGAATLDVNGLGATSIVKQHDQALITGDIESGQIVTVVYDGTNFQMQSQLAQGDQPYAVLQDGSPIYGASSGGTDTYAVTLAPVPAGYVNGMVINFKADVANTGAATLNVNGLGAVSITKLNDQALETGDIEANQIVQVVYNSTGPTFQMQSQTAQIPTIIAQKISQDGAQIYAADGGASDAYAITLSPVPSGYTTGMVVNFKANTANTGASSLDVNGLGAITIKKLHDQDTATGDIEAGQIVTVVYDGTNFQMQSQIAQVAAPANAVLQNGSPIYGLDAVGTDSYAITLTPSPGSYTVGMIINFQAATANTGAATLNVNGLGAIPIKKLFNAALNDNDIKAGQIVTVVYDGTNFQMQSQIANNSVVPSTSILVQRVSTQTGAVATGATAFPIDDTIPQNTEGDEYMTLSITPLNSANKLVITVTIIGSESTAASYAGFYSALFQDSTANALAAMGSSNYVSANNPSSHVYTHIMTAGTTSSTTFKVRAGQPTGSFVFNGVSGPTRQMGGVLASSIQISEYTA